MMFRYAFNWLWRQILNIKRESESADTVIVDDLRSIVECCTSQIVKFLEAFAEMDMISACKNHRDTIDELSTKKRIYNRSLSAHDGTHMIYIDYMIEATEKVAEISRLIITKPEDSISISTKCELLTIGSIFTRLSQRYMKFENGDFKADQFLTEIRNDGSFVKHLCGTHSKSMNHTDFEDGAIAYSYLMLLYYIHSYINSLEKVIEGIIKLRYA